MSIPATLFVWKSKSDNERTGFTPSRADITGKPYRGLLLCPLFANPLTINGESPEDIRERAERAVTEKLGYYLDDALPGTLETLEAAPEAPAKKKPAKTPKKAKP